MGAVVDAMNLVTGDHGRSNATVSQSGKELSILAAYLGRGSVKVAVLTVRITLSAMPR